MAAIVIVMNIAHGVEELVPGVPDDVTVGAVVVEVGLGVAPTVVKLPVTQALVRVPALERTRQ